MSGTSEATRGELWFPRRSLASRIGMPDDASLVIPETHLPEVHKSPVARDRGFAFSRSSFCFMVTDFHLQILSTQRIIPGPMTGSHPLIHVDQPRAKGRKREGERRECEEASIVAGTGSRTTAPRWGGGGTSSGSPATFGPAHSDAPTGRTSD